MKPETIESPESRASAATACWATARVVVIESERGWGQKVVERKEFPNMDAAMLFVREFNAEHCPPRDEVPEWYMQARVVD